MAEGTNMVGKQEEKIKSVVSYVRAVRTRQGIKELSRSCLLEPSCFVNGEFYNLVEFQLVNTAEGFGSWSSLKHAEILEGAYEYVTKGKRG